MSVSENDVVRTPVCPIHFKTGVRARVAGQFVCPKCGCQLDLSPNGATRIITETAQFENELEASGPGRDPFFFIPSS